jgi:hypothetical protein
MEEERRGTRECEKKADILNAEIRFEVDILSAVIRGEADILILRSRLR